MERKLWFLVVFCSLTLCLAKSQRSLGKPCTVPTTLEAGTCKPIKECTVLKEAPWLGSFFSGCGFQPIRMLVCCPISDISENPGASDRLSVSERKCLEFSEKIYGVKSGGREECDRTANLFVSESAKSREFPHIALVGFQSGDVVKYECGGALISDEYVLTSASCTYSKHYGLAKHVRLGELDRTTNGDYERPVDFRISNVVPHPEFRASSRRNDIGLLKLARKVTFDVFTHPACIPKEFQSVPEKLIATNWRDTLQKVVVENFGYNECRVAYPDISNNTQVCAGLREGAKDSCQGTIGDPLQILHSGMPCMYQIIGVTSYGYREGPCVFTKISAYHDWIEETVW